MKLIYILALMIVFFWVQAEDKDFTKVEMIINVNSTQLNDGDRSSTNPDDKKLSKKIADQIRVNECPAAINENLMSLVIINLASNKLKTIKPQDIFKCIEAAGFKSERNYTLMSDLLPLWTKDEMVEQFYIRYFKDYKKPGVSVLGLLDIAKIMCAKDAVSYLEQNNYPANFDKTMTTVEYGLFEEYINEYRCDGY